LTKITHWFSYQIGYLVKLEHKNDTPSQDDKGIIK
jgi:hypothetical protein